MSGSDKLIVVFMPALVAILLRAEGLKGSPLTEDEVLRIRDGSIAATLSIEALRDMEIQRGYRDIDPADCWTEWQRVRQYAGRLGDGIFPVPDPK